ncbi:MAG: hypothetical protein JSV29_01725 [Candidatus Bathyarchaeota archaeon]|nr:MAG: hypothetical protein JSV29_01725 [Candidatus Bathyarchaeota archaeon]
MVRRWSKQIMFALILAIGGVLFYAVGAYTLGEFELASSLEEFRRRTTWVVVPTIALPVGIAVFFGYEIYKMISK